MLHWLGSHSQVLPRLHGQESVMYKAHEPLPPKEDFTDTYVMTHRDPFDSICRSPGGETGGEGYLHHAYLECH